MYIDPGHFLLFSKVFEKILQLMYFCLNSLSNLIACKSFFREDLDEAKVTGDYTKIQEYYETTFGSLLDICATFKVGVLIISIHYLRLLSLVHYCKHKLEFIYFFILINLGNIPLGSGQTTTAF